MPIPVKCSGCQAKLNAPDAAAGKKVKCPKCGIAVLVPAGGAPVTAQKPVPQPAAAKKPAPARDEPEAEEPEQVEDRPAAQKGKPASGKQDAEPDEGAEGERKPGKAIEGGEGWKEFKILKQPAFLLKRVRPGFHVKQFPPKKRYTVTPVESEDVLANGTEKRSFWWIFLRSLLPFWAEFRDDEGQLLFRVRNYGWPLPDFKFFDSQGELFARFKAKGIKHVLKGGGYWVYDGKNEMLADIRQMNRKMDVINPFSHWGFIDNDGKEAISLIDEVRDAAKRKGGSSGWVKNPGAVIRFPSKKPADAFLKVLGIASALVMEIDNMALAPDTSIRKK